MVHTYRASVSCLIQHRYLLLVFITFGLYSPLFAVERPNVLLVLTDDQGFGDFSSHGNPILKTPHLDQLAASGARMERFFVSPVCAPTRASLLTGRYHLRTGVSGVTRGYEEMRGEEITIAELLKDEGYRTACIGKWHNGRHYANHPNQQGFEMFFGFCGGHWNTYFSAPLERNGVPVETQGYIADVLTDAAIDFVTESTKAPWFCYLAYNTPHSPWRVEDRYWDQFSGHGLDVKAQCAYAMVANLDDNMGRLLAAVAKSDQEKKTIVLFLTDNGANSDRFNAGMKGRKGSVDEGGTRVPLFIRYPGRIPEGKVVKPITFHLDILPTLMELCQVLIPTELQGKLDGQSFVPLLLEPAKEKKWPDRILFTETYRAGRGDKFMKAAVRTDRWRATMNKGRWRLYDMQLDPGQSQDVSIQHPAVTQRLSSAFQDWFTEIDQESLQERSIPVGFPDEPIITLPANEADLIDPTGDGIRYTGDTSSGYANSWITDWKDEKAFAAWPLDVIAAGKYRIELDYACSPENIGSQIEVTIGESVKKVQVNQAHDPPLLSKPDRLYSENYQDKASWKQLDLGEVHLEVGQAELEVHLSSIPGETGIELKNVRLSRSKY